MQFLILFTLKQIRLIPYNLLLLPLIAGYFLLVRSKLYKYNIQRFTQNRILFACVATSVVILFFAFVVRTLVEVFFPTVIPFIIETLKIVPVQKADYLWTAVFTFLLTLAYTWLTNLIIYIFWKESAPVEWAVDKHGDEIGKLFKLSLKDGKLIHITLKNNKVYVGFSATIPEPQKTNYLTLTPILSGYRNSDTKEITFTTDYLKGIEAYITDIQEKNDTDQLKLLSMDVIIRQDEILTAGIYIQEIFNINLGNSEAAADLTGQSI